jgi:hypothetical protein
VEGKQKGNGSGDLTFMAGGRLGFRGARKEGKRKRSKGDRVMEIYFP